MPMAMKKKIEKKSVTKRYKNPKTVEAIKRLTLDLKLKIASTRTQKNEEIGRIVLKNKQRQEQFPCYEDKLAIEPVEDWGKLLKKRVADNDV